MKDKVKSKEQLIRELTSLRRQLSRMKKAELTSAGGTGARSRRTEEKLLKVQQVAGMGVLEWDLKTNRIELSDEARRLYHMEDSGELETAQFIGRVVHPDDLHHVQKHLELALSGAKKYDIDHRIVRPDGMVLWVNAQAELEYDSSGEPATLVGTVWDITERKRSEEALRESEEKFSRIFNSTSNAMSISEPANDRIIDVNESWFRTTGYSREESIGRTALDLGLWESVSDRDRCMAEMKQAGRIRDFETVLVAKTHKATVLVSGVMIALGRTQHMLWELKDISERKRTEDALRESNELFSLFMRHSPIYTFMKTVTPNESRVLQVSDNYRRMLGVPAREMTGKTMAELFPPEFAAKMTADDWSAVAEGVVLNIDEDFNGRNYNTIKFPIVQGGKTLLAGYTIDVTDRKVAEEALRHSEERHRAILRTAMDGFWLLDTTGQLLEVNETYCRMSGYSEREMLAMRASDLEALETADETAAHVRLVISQGEDRFESRHRRKDGSTFDVEVRVQYRPVEGGRFVAFLRDITESKKALKEKDNFAAQLQHARKMESVGRLAGGVAHDFNNMLGVILGHADLALRQMDPGLPLFESIMQIRTAAERSADITRQLLAFARRETIAPRVLDLNKAVANMLKMLKRLIGEHIDLDWQPGKDLWPVRFDPSQIDHVLANLCVNARDAIKGFGRITIQTRNGAFDENYCATRAGLAAGEYVVLALSDTGCGMNKETQSRIFEPFFTTKGVGKGTGLGLSTVYGAVKQNAGFLEVSSRRGRGSTFTIYLPRCKGTIELEQLISPVEPTRHENRTILLVEDEAAILDLTKQTLEMLGYTVLAASAPGEAIRLAAEHSGEIHMLLTDVVMPGMDGWDLAKTLMPHHPGMKPLFMSGYPAEAIAHFGVPKQDVNFIQKPFSLDALAEKVLAVLCDQ